MMPHPGDSLPSIGEGDEYVLVATEHPTYDVGDDYAAKLVGWRMECFERRGFTPLAATALAVRRDVDRERVERLLDRGATHLQVVAILL